MAVDLNGDGALDLVSANQQSSNLTIFLQRKPGEFPSDPDQTLGGAGKTNTPVSVVASDLDGDGDFDLVSANQQGANLTIFFQGNSGEFPADPDLVLGGPGRTAFPVSVAAADLNGDGKLDLVSANVQSNTLTIFFQTKPGKFPSDPDRTLGGAGETRAPASVAASDLDGDGDLDLVSANLGGQNLTVFLQEGDGEFPQSPSLTFLDPRSSGLPVFVAPGDVDGDGDLDLVSANGFFGNNLIIFLQRGGGVFTPHPSGPLGDAATTRGPASVAAADLDGDGDLELISANRTGNNLTIFYGSR